MRVVEAALGQVVADAEGRRLFDLVEAMRRDMVALRKGQSRALARGKRRLRGLPLDERMALARAYTVYLELVNVCENAYRTHRLDERARAADPADAATPRAHVIFVLTAHPTESRSPTNIRLMRRIQALLVAALDRREPPDQKRLTHLLHLVWRTGTHPAHKPTVEDEAQHLFSLLDDEILEELLRLRHDGHRVRLRTWVGGDKDGHPGVGPEETQRSLALSRTRLLELVDARMLPEIDADIRLLSSPPLTRAWTRFGDRLQAIRTLTIGDGRRMRRLRADLNRVAAEYRRRRGAAHPRLDDVSTLLGQFPGLVVPLELREERGRFGRDDVIADMLRFTRDVARGGAPEWYVRGCVVSMTEEAEDLWAAHALVEEVFGATPIPVVPLFELPEVLPRAPAILERALNDTTASPAARFGAAVRAHGSLEVMLGYSDTSKRMGVLASRMAIHDTMRALGRWAAAQHLTLIFFHGSGGSVGRGGGTVADQAATWPAGAMAVIKQTLQGEMVERTLATPAILRSQVMQIADIQARPPRFTAASRAARHLAAHSGRAFASLVGSRGLLELLEAATPYTRLGALNIGSRPVKRAGGGPGGLESLRAIPWVLCWTQTRYLAHAWIGVGTAWRDVRNDPERRRQLLRACQRDPFLRGYLRLLRFTLAKTAPDIWREYVRALAGGAGPTVRRLEREWQDARDLALQLTDGTLLDERRWLAESIHYRATMIHPLNLIQIEILTHPRLTRAQELLFRETVTGIAAGMLTTG